MNCFPLIFQRNCSCFQKETFQIPTSEFLSTSDFTYFWSNYVSEYIDILKRHFCDPVTGNRIIFCNSNLYVSELHNFLKTLQIYEDFAYASSLESNLIKLNNSNTSVQIGTFIRIFRNYAKNQLEIVQYFLSSDEPIIIKKLLKLLDVHSAVLKNFASQQKSNGGILPEDLLRELEDFVNSSIGFSESG